MSEKARRRLEISITGVFVLALLLVGAVLIFSGGIASAKQIATLRLLGGQVEVRHGTQAFQPGEQGVSLREGDTVRTGVDGRASIEYFDGSETLLDYDTTFRLVTLETLRNAAGSNVIEGNQVDGNSYNRVVELTDPDSRFAVQTPTATASARGTVYAVIVDQGATTIAVVEGVVEALGDAGPVDVGKGTMVVVGADGSLGPVKAISQELLDSEWLSFNRCELDHAGDCVQSEPPQPGGQPGTHPPNPEGGQQGSLPPGGTTGAGGPGGTTGGGPPPAPPPPIDRPPVAGFTASPQMGPAPLRVQFSDTSRDPDGDPVSRHWSFGDGSSQSGGLDPSHTYTQAGDYTVKLTVSDPDGKTDSKTRVVSVGSLAVFDHVVIAPSTATIKPSGSQAYTAEAFDTDGNSMGDVTANTGFSIAPDGSCIGNDCTATQPGVHTVTGTFSGDSDTATLTVEEPPPPPCPHYELLFGSRPPSTQEAGHQFNVQVKVHVLDGGSSTGPLTIGLVLSGGSFSDGETSTTWTGQGTVTFNHLRIDEAGTYGLIAEANCATPTDTASITITDPSGGHGPGGPIALVLLAAAPPASSLARRATRSGPRRSPAA